MKEPWEEEEELQQQGQDRNFEEKEGNFGNKGSNRRRERSWL